MLFSSSSRAPSAVEMLPRRTDLVEQHLTFAVVQLCGSASGLAHYLAGE